MAYTGIEGRADVLNREITATRKVFDSIATALASVVTGFGAVLLRMAENSTMNVRAQKAQALMAMTDEELAALNIRRADIHYHVFGPAYFI